MQLSERPADDPAAELPPPADPAQPNLTMRLQSGHQATQNSPSKKGALMVLGLIAVVVVVALVISALR